MSGCVYIHCDRAGWPTKVVLSGGEGRWNNCDISKGRRGSTKEERPVCKNKKWQAGLHPSEQRGGTSVDIAQTGVESDRITEAFQQGRQQ